MKLSVLFYIICTVLLLCSQSVAKAEIVHTLIVEITTGDVRFAGTDDPVHLVIGGKDFNLDNINKDDFERNNTDTFILTVNDSEFTSELIRAIGTIAIVKSGDSFFGGGWNFKAIKIWSNDAQSDPIYINESVNKWLDGDDRNWSTNVGDEGWNIPEPPPFPPCYIDDIIILLNPAGSTGSSKKRKLDSDCDGIPDDADATFDPDQPDEDKDGLPDRYEEQNGLNPLSNDTDSDGWLDNNNFKDVLLLTKVDCIDESNAIELGSDETYVTLEDVRFPLSPTLDNYWVMDDGAVVEPFIVVDTRMAGNISQLAAYKSRIRLRESDYAFFENPWDNTLEQTTLDWRRNELKEINADVGSVHYKLTFKSIAIPFMDPNPLDSAADGDGDDINELLEFRISSQEPGLRPAGTVAVLGYNGLASPFRTELFVEVDATSEDDNLQFDAKQQVASQFYYHNISTRIDDGYLKGGEILPYDEEVQFSELQTYYNNSHWDERKRHYRYTLFVPESSSNGRASRPGKRILISRSTMLFSFSSIVFIHEWGHTLGLSHPMGTSEPPSPSPTCPSPPGWNATWQPLRCTNPVSKSDSIYCALTYCGVGDDDTTAMGDDIDAQTWGTGIAVGIFVGLAIIALFIPGIGWIAAIGLLALAGIIGGVVGLFFSDPAQRVVDYHPNEWAALFFNVFQ